MRLLIIGNAYDSHMQRFLTNLNKVSDFALEITLISPVNDDKKLSKVANLCNYLFFTRHHFMPFFYSIPKVQNILAALDFRKTVKEVTSGIYDCVNIHYVSVDNAFCYKIYRHLSKHILVMPYGSDILRAPLFNRLLISHLCHNADAVCAGVTHLSQLYQKFFHYPTDRFVPLRFGSDLIDYITEHDDSKEFSKKIMHLENKYVVTIGYNASSGQNHIPIIDSLSVIKDKIPDNVCFVFPMTYPQDAKDYINLISQRMQRENMPYLIVDRFLNIDELFHLRNCSDLFINAQKTDAACSSLLEYLLTGNSVLNASWLPYPDIEKHQRPYQIFSTYEEMSNLFLSQIANHQRQHIEPSLFNYIVSCGWRQSIKDWSNYFKAIGK